METDGICQNLCRVGQEKKKKREGGGGKSLGYYYTVKTDPKSEVSKNFV